MVHYKLIYFNGRGAAEIIRQLFVIAGKEYEDVRLIFEEWPKYKPEMPFGQVPVLEVDGQKLAQSLAIVRYLAREFGYAGKTPFEEALVDSIGDQYKDFVNEARPYFRVALGFQEGDEAPMKAIRPKRQTNKTVPSRLADTFEVTTTYPPCRDLWKVEHGV